MRGMVATGVGLAFSRAAADDAVLDSLMEQTRTRDFGQGFDSASRNILMPNASLPTLDPSTAQTTEAAIARYEEIAGANHFTALDPLSDPDSAMVARLVELAKKVQ